MQNHRKPCFLAILAFGLSCSMSNPAAAQGHFDYESNTGDSYSIIINEGPGCSLTPGDEIGVFDGDLCVGAAAVTGNWPIPLAAWQDNSQTSGVTDGYVCGNQILFRLWHNAQEIEAEAGLDYSLGGDGTFCYGAYSWGPLICEGCCVIRGDIIHSGDLVLDISDLTYLVSFMFQFGPGPPCMAEADTNGEDGESPDISDLITLVEYMFQAGPPVVPCP